jgi:hypothetical protein
VSFVDGLVDQAAGLRELSRPVVVVDDLGLLAGPNTGTHRLPSHLDWGPHPFYDLAVPGQVTVMYRAVLREAFDQTDLVEHLDAGLLVRFWPTLFLPGKVRQAWQTAHEVLAQAQ